MFSPQCRSASAIHPLDAPETQTSPPLPSPTHRPESSRAINCVPRACFPKPFLQPHDPTHRVPLRVPSGVSLTNFSEAPGPRPAQHLGQLQARAAAGSFRPVALRAPESVPRAGPFSQDPPTSRAALAPAGPPAGLPSFLERPEVLGARGFLWARRALPALAQSGSRRAAGEWPRFAGRGAWGRAVDTAFRCPLAATPRHGPRPPHAPSAPNPGGPRPAQPRVGTEGAARPLRGTRRPWAKFPARFSHFL